MLPLRRNTTRILKENSVQIVKSSISCPKETQTENDISLKCMECNFNSVSTEEWKWHIYENHGWPNIVEISDNDKNEHEQGLICKECKYKAEDIYDYDGHVWSEICTDPTVQKEKEENLSKSCEYCEDKFASLRELMHHKKNQHAENVNPCWNYASGKCDFGDDKCWFIHKSENGGRFECTSCETTFAVQAKLLQHRKQNHIDSVQSCRNMVSGACKYGIEKYWFNNSDLINENGEKLNDNEEVVEKIFKMMEKFTKQLVEIKEVNNLK